MGENPAVMHDGPVGDVGFITLDSEVVNANVVGSRSPPKLRPNTGTIIDTSSLRVGKDGSIPVSLVDNPSFDLRRIATLLLAKIERLSGGPSHAKGHAEDEFIGDGGERRGSSGFNMPIPCKVSVNKSPQKLWPKTKNPSRNGLVGGAVSELPTPVIELVSSDVELLASAVLNEASAEVSRSSASHTLFHLGCVGGDDHSPVGSLPLSPAICDVAPGEPPEVF
jgi:hypothetical protein